MLHTLQLASNMHLKIVCKYARVWPPKITTKGPSSVKTGYGEQVEYEQALIII